MQISHSRIELFKTCKFKYKCRYIDKLETLKADNADNALFLGTALHSGIEKGAHDAISEYFMQYPVITDAHINESIKLETMIAKVKKVLPQGEFEVKIDCDDFVGYIDLLAPVTTETRLNGDYQVIPNVYDLYDFKYSNNVEHYRESVQLHLYKYFFEKINPDKKIRKLIYLCVPKVSIRQKKTETLSDFRKRLNEELTKAEPQLIEVEYDQNKVMNWMFDVKHTIEAEEFPKERSYLCRFCDYNEYCAKGVDYMLLPKNERRNIEKIEKKVVWLYGAPFSGKTTFANKFNDPLMLNTDGNIKFVDAPYVSIKDNIEVTGRITKKTFAWEVFKDVIAELEKKQNDFKTIIVDLLEDCYEYCRLWVYDQMKITHESDDARSWDKVTVEFLSTLKRLMALDYENIILISHEDMTKDIMKRGGDKVTAIKPSLRDKVANKVAGMVDIVGRVIADGSSRTLSFKSNVVILGGGRLSTKTNEIPLVYEAFLEVYDDANKSTITTQNKHVEQSKETITTEVQGDVLESTETLNEVEKVTLEVADEQPKTRTRKKRV